MKNWRRTKNPTLKSKIRKYFKKKYDSSYINEAINFEKKIIFIAIPKTGTNSVRQQIPQDGNALIPNPHLNICQIRELIYPWVLKNNLGTNRNFSNFNMVDKSILVEPADGIMASDNELRQKANDIFKSFFKFSAVRNPWARAVSLYMRREGLMLQDKITFDEFCENHINASDTSFHPTLHKNQLDWLTSDKGELLMDFVYKVEEFNKAIDIIYDKTEGRVKLNNIKRNVNPNSMSSTYRNMYNDKTKKIIEKRFKKDIDYFKYKF